MRKVVLEHAAVARWLERETPGPESVLGHVLTTGHGRAWADRWPEPSVLLTETGGNYLLLGEPEAVDPDELRPLVRGFLAAPPELAPVLAAAFPDRVVWDRVVWPRTAAPSAPSSAAGWPRSSARSSRGCGTRTPAP